MANWFKRGAGKDVAAKAEKPELTSRERVLREYRLDAERFMKYSIPAEEGEGPRSVEGYQALQGMNLDATTIRHAHKVEKGLALPAPKRPFGRSLPNRALSAVLGRDDLPDEAFYLEEARIALASLQQWNDGGDLADVSAPRGDSLPTNPLDAETLAHFLTSRHSVRNFEPRTMDRELVTEAVRLAAYAPSVCNRQAWRIYYFDDPTEIATVLALHSGSAGFADNVPGLFLITYDIGSFERSMERNQGWIDGGLYSMNLMLALHGLGFGSVPLNWSRKNWASKKMRALVGIPENENIVMLIGAGHPAEGYRVARSARRPLEQILKFGLQK
ncbi:nitroreductase [Marmoricola sp. OAE513]|uniref:nitroreductase family protein n=1 Tax=Marmoricola sp. OAE513 TaxID=2817894 RepID=UPI001AE24B2A